MTRTDFERLPESQQQAMRRLQERSGIPWDEFLDAAYVNSPNDPYVAIPNFHGMFIGIEPDGYTHS